MLRLICVPPEGKRKASGHTGNGPTDAVFTGENEVFGTERSATRSSQCAGDPDLTRINAVWHSLPVALRSGILAMFNAASPPAAIAKLSRPRTAKPSRR